MAGVRQRFEDPTLYGDLVAASDAASVLDAAGVERAAVLGVSQAGSWALAFALATLHPERVSAAVFIAANVPPRARSP